MRFPLVALAALARSSRLVAARNSPSLNKLIEESVLLWKVSFEHLLDKLRQIWS